MIRRLTVLGSGTILPLPGHGCPGYLLERDRSPVLVDCGPGTLYRLAEAGRSPADLQLILISHFHLDHVSDLAAILLARWMLAGAQGAAIELAGPPGLPRYLRWMGRQMEPWFREHPPKVTVLGPRPQRIGELTIASVPTGHTRDSLALRISEADGTAVFYSGDTDVNPALISLARQADLAVIECSMPDELKAEGHLTPRLAAELAAEAQVRRLLLTHFYREVLETDVLAQARRAYRGPICLARDLESFPVR